MTLDGQSTAALLDAMLCSWQALIKLDAVDGDAEGKKFLKLLTNKDNVLLMCLQKKLQSDSLTIVDIEPEGEKFRNRVNKLSMGISIGSWEEGFKEWYDEESNEFCKIKL